MTKQSMINDKILPFFGKKRLRDIEPGDILDWQNELLGKRKKNGKPYSGTYVRTVDSQLVAILLELAIIPRSAKHTVLS